jgi:hypothetical protein
MDASEIPDEIPDDIAAVIAECWPEGVVGEFDTDESYFHDIRPALERDLKRIPGAALMWQTEMEDDGGGWQSYHVFFVAPQEDEFEFDTETENVAEPEEPGAEQIAVTSAGKGWYGCVVAVSYAASFAAMNLGELAEFDDGSAQLPDIVSYAYSEENGEPVDIDAEYLDILGEDAFRKLDDLRASIAKVLAKHEVGVLDQAILDLPAPDLSPDSAVLADGPLLVRDAFFFRGV